MKKWFKELLRFIKRRYPSFEAYRIEKTTIQDWIEAIDTLIPLIQASRREFDPARYSQFDLDTFETNSYLYQVDRLVIKIREYILGLRYHETHYANKPDILKRIEFINTSQACLDCYSTIINLILLFQRLPKEALPVKEFFLHVQALELECATLRSAIRALNQFVTQYESTLHITQLEQTLLQSVEQSRLLSSKSPEYLLANYLIGDPSLLCNSTEQLRKKLGLISQEQDWRLLLAMIDSYDSLRRCYVVVRKQVVKETLDAMYIVVQELLNEFSKNEIEKERALFYFYMLFNQIESLRFSSNRESRCSRNLFEKSKRVRHTLRKACYAHPLAREFINQIAVPRVSLLKDYKISK